MKYTLITGASSGIGEEFAKQFAEKGHALILVARSEEKLNQLAEYLTKKYSVQIHVVKQDLGHLNSAHKVFETCQNRKLEINLLVNNAGIGHIGSFEEENLDHMEEMLILNVITLTKLIYLFLPQLKKNKGSIINVASQAAFQPLPYMASYGATKAYVLNFSEALRVELKDSGVPVTALCPGPTYTRFFERIDSSIDQIRFKFRTPKQVVAYAIEGVKKKKSIVMPGFENRFMTFMNRFMPRPFLAKMSQFMVKTKEEL